MKLYSKKQLETVKFVSSDDTRQALQSVLIEGNSVIATDGHRLLKITNNEINTRASDDKWPVNGVAWDDNEEPFLLQKSAVEKAIKNVPKPKDVGATPICLNVAIGKVEEGEKIVCQTTDLDTTDQVTAKRVDGKFPNYKQVMPDKSDYIKVGISAKYLKEVCQVLEKYNDNSMVALHVRPDGGNNQQYPIMVTTEDDNGNEAQAVIMPMKL
jgi:DNA polymerase III sliding clamp (beta) subunit (PCNA family)